MKVRLFIIVILYISFTLNCNSKFEDSTKEDPMTKEQIFEQLKGLWSTEQAWGGGVFIRFYQTEKGFQLIMNDGPDSISFDKIELSCDKKRYCIVFETKNPVLEFDLKSKNEIKLKSIKEFKMSNPNGPMNSPFESTLFQKGDILKKYE
ncbi:hypothetical protein FH581_000690 [Leptospira weilii]|uniref:hypothetical protein n=2 Tax=Leptospira weilii TaxID=28184 RepID=UPI000B0BE502|nr:hypothetical protein [Leptospira weilii]ULH27591.1 hypothetical protein FH586_14410 [Leptospira weilii]UPY77407.1 hypothetical protein FH581_000690 [Leptospira weilii]